jgi:hypothetical protein
MDKGYLCVPESKLSTYKDIITYLPGNEKDFLFVIDRQSDATYYYLKHYWHMEQCVLNEIIKLQSTDIYGYPNLDKLYSDEPIIKEVSNEQAYALRNYSDIIIHENKAYLQPLLVNKNCTLSKDQTVAVTGALNNHVSLIVGEAGTGKSKCIIELVNSLAQKRTILIVTPTGIAAGRLRKELRKTKLDITASTIHSAIGFRTMKINTPKTSDKEDKCSRIKYFKQKFDHIIVDEAGMVSLELFYNLFRFFYGFKYLTLVGDNNQLLPIKAAPVLQELLLSKTLPTYYLTINHRSIVDGTENYITKNAKTILSGYGELKSINNFSMHDGEINHVVGISTLIRNNGKIDYRNVSVITPFKNPLPELNNALRTLWNSDNLCDEQTARAAWKRLEEFAIKANQTINVNAIKICWESEVLPYLPNNIKDSWNNDWAIGDKIRMRVNNNPCEVFNGDEGIILNWAYGTIGKHKLVYVPGMMVHFFNHDDGHYTFVSFVAADEELGKSKTNEQNGDYSLTPVEILEDESDDNYNNELCTYNLTHSYASTIHSCQGAEYECVIFYLPPSSNASANFFNRNMLYTIITRGKKSVYCVGDHFIMNNAIRLINKEEMSHIAKHLANRLPPLQPLIIKVAQIDDEPLCDFSIEDLL